MYTYFVTPCQGEPGVRGPQGIPGETSVSREVNLKVTSTETSATYLLSADQYTLIFVVIFIVSI